jgi:hypothetical protein
MLIDDEPLLKGSIDDLNNANKYEEAAEKEDDDEDDNINIDPNISIDKLHQTMMNKSSLI